MTCRVDLSGVHDRYHMARDCGLGSAARRTARMTRAPWCARFSSLPHPPPAIFIHPTRESFGCFLRYCRNYNCYYIAIVLMSYTYNIIHTSPSWVVSGPPFLFCYWCFRRDKRPST